MMDKILIVEDELPSLEALVKRFREKGYEVVGADSKKEAIESIRKSAPFDVAIVDIKLSDLDEEGGLDVTKELRSKDLFTQIIILTAYGVLKNVYKAMKYGIWQYIDKNMEGVNVNELLTLEVEKALRHKKGVIERFLGKPKEDIPKRLRYRRSAEIEKELLEGLRRFGLPEGMVTEKQIEEVLDRQQDKGDSLEEILIGMGIEEGCINNTLSRQLDIDYIYLAPDQIDAEVIQSFQEELLRAHCLIPIAKRDNHLILLMADPKDSQIIEKIKSITRCEVGIFLGSPTNIMEIIDRVFGEIDRKKSISQLPVEVQ